MKEEEIEEEEKETEPKNVVQKIVDIPLIGDTIAFIIGFFPPYFLAIFLLPSYSKGDETQKILINLLMSFLIFVWTFILYFIFRIKLTFPIIPIPFFVIGLFGMIYQIVRYFMV